MTAANATNGRPLTVHEAKVTTATIQIKTLTVGRRMVTLAVFRQLRQAALLDAAGNLRGLPWGQVNYHPDCRSTEEYRGIDRASEAHLHVVWQLGDELRQAVLRRPHDNPWAIEVKRNFDEGERYSVRPRPVTVLSGYTDSLHCPTCAAGGGVQPHDAGADLGDLDLPGAEEVPRAPSASWPGPRGARRQWEALNDLPQLFIAV